MNERSKSELDLLICPGVEVFLGPCPSLLVLKHGKHFIEVVLNSLFSNWTMQAFRNKNTAIIFINITEESEFCRSEKCAARKELVFMFNMFCLFYLSYINPAPWVAKFLRCPASLCGERGDRKRTGNSKFKTYRKDKIKTIFKTIKRVSRSVSSQSADFF